MCMLATVHKTSRAQVLQQLPILPHSWLWQPPTCPLRYSAVREAALLPKPARACLLVVEANALAFAVALLAALGAVARQVVAAAVEAALALAAGPLAAALGAIA